MAKHDEQVKVLLKTIDEKLEKLGDKPKAVLNTNGVLKYSEDEQGKKQYVNLNTIFSIEKAVQAFSFVLYTYNSLCEASRELNVPVDGILISGYSLEDWKKDFMFRISVIQWTEERNKLLNAKQKLEYLMSDDLRTEQEIESLIALLSS